MRLITRMKPVISHLEMIVCSLSPVVTATQTQSFIRQACLRVGWLHKPNKVSMTFSNTTDVMPYLQRWRNLYISPRYVISLELLIFSCSVNCLHICSAKCTGYLFSVTSWLALEPTHSRGQQITWGPCLHGRIRLQTVILVHKCRNAEHVQS
jgi:hypothetical protein